MNRYGLVAAALLTFSCTSEEANKVDPLDDDAIVYPVPDWQVADASELGFDPESLQRLATLADANDSHCLFVTRKGRVVGEWYWDGWTRDSQQIVHSVTKSITSTLVGIAQDRGELQVEQKASTYIPEWQGGASAEVTIRDLLSNASGRHWDFFADYLQMAGLARDKTQFAIDLGQDHAPGTYWEYNNSAIQTLARILEKSTKETDVAEFARKHLFEPIGMKSALAHDAADNALMYGEMPASCSDLARFGYLFLRRGKWANGTTIVSEGWVSAATSTSTPLNVAYGYLWWLNRNGRYVRPSAPSRVEGDGKQIEELPEAVFSALGLGGQIVMVDPEHEIVMTRIGGAPSSFGAALDGADPTGAAVVAELGNALAKALIK